MHEILDIYCGGSVGDPRDAVDRLQRVFVWHGARIFHRPPECDHRSLHQFLHR